MLVLKQIYLSILLFIGFSICTHAQVADTALLARDSFVLPKDSSQINNISTIVTADSSFIIKDSNIAKVVMPVKISLEKLLLDNKYLNSKGAPVSLAVVHKKENHQDAVFYILTALVLFFGILKKIYDRYFSTLFRVFFNSSLRQNQLTDQLLQSKLPSLFFNIIFLFASGIYVYLLLKNLYSLNDAVDWKLLGICIAAFFIIYIVKFLTLKFVGWITGFKAEADTYIFVVFLINKIIGICLLPAIIVLAFSQQYIVNVITIISFLIIGIMLLLRFFRSYGLLNHKLKVSSFHFALYIFSFEILPLLLIYKFAVLFIGKNL